MIFSYFPSVKAQTGQRCTAEMFHEATHSAATQQIIKAVREAETAEDRQRIKKGLPIITWQASFPNRRVNAEAVPSGLFMLDIDHIDNPSQLYIDKVAGHLIENGIKLVHVTPSGKGLRIVALCRSEFKTLEECQRWLAEKLGVEFDEACKDWARASYIPWYNDIIFLDGSIFDDVPSYFTAYENKYAQPFEVNEDFERTLDEAAATNTEQYEGLFGEQTDYKGIPLDKIIEEWIAHTGGPITQGERNTRLYSLALRLRYITDFNVATMQRIMPDCGLSKQEIAEICRHAASATRGQHMPLDMAEVIDRLREAQQVRQNLNVDDTADPNSGEVPPIINDTSKLPPFPPVIRQWVEISPDDFKAAVAISQLPILGALGSRLRAKYLDNRMHSPSFQVSLEAPQASGKSFLARLVNYEMEQIIDHDEEQRQQEREYDEKVKQLKLLNIKVNVDNKDEILGSKPKTMVRFVPATMSITKLLMRMDAAQGLHLFAMSEEIDTITKAFKRGFSSYSDLLRVAFDNGMYGQDYASENSFSGMLPIYYNMLASGTPKAMRRFYPDVEDGLVSRVCFVVLPDQFGKPMPVWREFSNEQKLKVDVNLVRLNEVSIQGDEVQPEHIMKLEFLNAEMQKWILAQQAEAVRLNDRTRDIFCRRAAVVGFRAGMLAYFLYGEKNTPTIRRNTVKFAIWVSNYMLSQHLIRFNVSESSNVVPFRKLLEQLPEEFTRKEVEKVVAEEKIDTPTRIVIFKWRMAGLIEEVAAGRGKGNQPNAVSFKKIKK